MSRRRRSGLAKRREATDSTTTPAPARQEDEIFADLQALCTSPGYIHAIAYFSWRDNLIRYDGRKLVAKDLYYQHSHDKLIRTEIATLIGLLAQKPLEVSVPEPMLLNNYVERTEALLRELHSSMQKPWFEGWDIESGVSPSQDPFANAASMREPIFYGGESAYPFQYRDFARLKYRADDDWLETNRGFGIEEAVQIVDALVHGVSRMVQAVA